MAATSWALSTRQYTSGGNNSLVNIRGQGALEGYSSAFVNGTHVSSVVIPQEIKDSLPCPQWLSSWEEAEFTGLGEIYLSPPLGTDSNSLELQASYWLVSMTGGIWLEQSEETNLVKRDAESTMEAKVLEYFKTGDQAVLQDVHQLFNVTLPSYDTTDKRAWACFSRTRWIRGSRHKASWYAVLGLADSLSGACNWLWLNRSALCSGDADRVQACASWSGGWQSLPSCMIKATVDSSMNFFGEFNPDISATCYDCGHYGDAKRSYHEGQMCVSNRPNGCGNNSFDKRGVWDTDSHGWCDDSPY